MSLSENRAIRSIHHKQLHNSEVYKQHFPIRIAISGSKCPIQHTQLVIWQWAGVFASVVVQVSASVPLGLENCTLVQRENPPEQDYHPVSWHIWQAGNLFKTYTMHYYHHIDIEIIWPIYHHNDDIYIYIHTVYVHITIQNIFQLQ